MQIVMVFEQATVSCKEWTRPLRVLPAAQCPLQTSPITQPRARYIHTALPHASCTLHCAVRLARPHKTKEICPSLPNIINRVLTTLLNFLKMQNDNALKLVRRY